MLWPTSRFSIPNISNGTSYSYPVDDVIPLSASDAARNLLIARQNRDNPPADTADRTEPVNSNPASSDVKQVTPATANGAPVPACTMGGATIVSFLGNILTNGAQWVENGSNPNIINCFHSIGQAGINSDQTAWCMAFVNFVSKSCGYKYTGTMRAADIRTTGQATLVTSDVTQIAKLGQPGDVILQHPSSANQAGSGHVQFLYAINSDGTIATVGGNEGPDKAGKVGYTHSVNLTGGKFPAKFRELWRPQCG